MAVQCWVKQQCSYGLQWVGAVWIHSAPFSCVHGAKRGSLLCFDRKKRKMTVSFFSIWATCKETEEGENNSPILCNFVSLWQKEMLQSLRTVLPKITLCYGNSHPAVMRPLMSQDRARDIPVKLLRLIWGEWHYQLPPFEEFSEGADGDWKCFLRSWNTKV